MPVEISKWQAFPTPAALCLAAPPRVAKRGKVAPCPAGEIGEGGCLSPAFTILDDATKKDTEPTMLFIDLFHPGDILPDYLQTI